MTPDAEHYRSARLARDPRFDGTFFVAVKTTGIYCRPVCPAPAPKEANVVYFQSAAEAAANGFRPCLRCRPESAPGSWAWKGVDTTFERALKLIDQGVLTSGNLAQLAERLGISDRYLRRVFAERCGLSPKQYAQYRQLLFSKQLLHETRLPVSEVAIASGFNSVRRFNDSFSRHFSLTPGQVRRSGTPAEGPVQLKLVYRPPFNWSCMRGFLARRKIPGMEWVTEQSLGRTFSWDNDRVRGYFTARHCPDENAFRVDLSLSDTSALIAVVNNIRRILDLDADSGEVDAHLSRTAVIRQHLQPGLRLPGIWNLYEAGIRAILGQQVSVRAATQLVTQLVSTLGVQQDDRFWFPLPGNVAEHSLDFLKIPMARKQTLRDFSRVVANQSRSVILSEDMDSWREVKGIGQWTVDYARLRGLSDPDIWLGSDLGVRKVAAERLQLTDDVIKSAAPWRSYLTFQCWSQL